MTDRRNAQYHAPIDGRAPRRAFTLTELLIAVVVLLVILLAVSRIFTTTTEVTSRGRATSDVSQDLVAIERRMREDIQRVSSDGFLVIRCVAVPNNVRGNAGPLLNPELPRDAYVRSDQLVIFADGVERTKVYPSTVNGDDGAAGMSNLKGLSTLSRIYYGHGFQIPDAPPANYVGGSWRIPNVVPTFDDPVPGIVPWRFGEVELTTNGSNTITRSIAPLPANQWTLARQAVLIADTGGADDLFFGGAWNSGGNYPASPWLYLNDDNDDFHHLLNSRVDISTQTMNLVREDLQAADDWPEMRDWILSDYAFYPRAEPVAPGGLRQDYALTAPTLGAAASNIRIEWTYDNRAGNAVNDQGVEYFGTPDPDFGPADPPAEPHPWFGLPVVPESEVGNVGILDLEPRTLTAWLGTSGLPNNGTIAPSNIEGENPYINEDGIVLYEAVFGFNRDMPFDAEWQNSANTVPHKFIGEPREEVAYTPLPTAIRVTMTLHGRDGLPADGREVQFIIDLPRR